MVVRGDPEDVDATGAHRIPQEDLACTTGGEKGGRRRIEVGGELKKVGKSRAAVCRRKERKTNGPKGGEGQIEEETRQGRGSWWGSRQKAAIMA